MQWAIRLTVLCNSYYRFGEWDEIGKMADEAEATRVAITQEYVDANPDGLTNAERWTWRVSDSGWGRAIWAYVLVLHVSLFLFPCRQLE